MKRDLQRQLNALLKDYYRSGKLIFFVAMCIIMRSCCGNLCVVIDLVYVGKYKRCLFERALAGPYMYLHAPVLLYMLLLCCVVVWLPLLRSAVLPSTTSYPDVKLLPVVLIYTGQNG